VWLLGVFIVSGVVLLLCIGLLVGREWEVLSFPSTNVNGVGQEGFGNEI